MNQTSQAEEHTSDLTKRSHLNGDTLQWNKSNPEMNSANQKTLGLFHNKFNLHWRVHILGHNTMYPLNVNRRFGGTCCLYLKSQEICHTRNQSSVLYLVRAVFLRVFFLYLKMEAKSSSETSVDIQRNTYRSISKDIALRNQQCENLKSLPLLHSCVNLKSYVLSMLRAIKKNKKKI